ncbi:unnamed protein product [Enterobius vermicularis]|uniref:Mab-21 domain-containing protein n=1 Tax=Enterobius vermicularis TaxID=51028 RepID=A0A0N4V272_ENTVE|nr:unnamed protein product [Enterobius vermicularis]
MIFSIEIFCAFVAQVDVKLNNYQLTRYFNVRKRKNDSGYDMDNLKANLKRHCQRSESVVKLHSLEFLNQEDCGLVYFSPLGNFAYLPPELLQNILNFTPCLLINAATEYLPLSTRLYILSKFYVKNITVEHCAKGWGSLFYAIYEKLNGKERLGFMDSIFSMDANSLWHLLTLVLGGIPGAFPNCEIKVRRLIRGFFLETCRHSNVNEVAFWMSAVTRTQKTASSRARLLFLLYGPVSSPGTEEESIDWRILVDSAVTTYAESMEYLRPLSDALYFLASSKYLPENLAELTWNETEMFNVIEELTTSPEPWSFDNFAGLILHRPCLIPLTFVPRVMNGFVNEAGQLFNTMKTLLYRWGLNGPRYLGKYITYAMQALPPLERYFFVAAVHRAFSNQLQDHLAVIPAAQDAFGEEIKSARSNASLIRLIERFV